MTPWRRFVLVIAFEGALLAVAAALGRVSTALVIVVCAAAVIETVRLWRALQGRTPVDTFPA